MYKLLVSEIIWPRWDTNLEPFNGRHEWSS